MNTDIGNAAAKESSRKRKKSHDSGTDSAGKDGDFLAYPFYPHNPWSGFGPNVAVALCGRLRREGANCSAPGEPHQRGVQRVIG